MLIRVNMSIPSCYATYSHAHSYSTGPEQPVILTEACSTANNTVTIAWSCSGHPDGYCLELDDGNNGHFRVSIICNILITSYAIFVYYNITTKLSMI